MKGELHCIACCKVGVKRNPAAVTHFLAQIGFPICALLYLLPLIPAPLFIRHVIFTLSLMPAALSPSSSRRGEGAGGEVRTA